MPLRWTLPRKRECHATHCVLPGRYILWCRVHIKQLKTGYHGYDVSYRFLHRGRTVYLEARSYAFEALCTTPSETKANTVQVDLDVWKCIASRTLGDLNLVFGAEVDCVRGWCACTLVCSVR